MPNIAKVIREEIARISRHEAKAAVAPVRKPVFTLRMSVADLKRRLAALEAENKRLQSVIKTVEAAMPVPPVSEEAGRVRLTARSIKSLRRKLKLSQDNFARLAGVSSQAVYLWEGKKGGLKLRKETMAALLAVRNITATEAAARLAASKKASKAKKPARRGKR